MIWSSYEIVLRLPVKYILRFRCVSKLWRSVIDSDLFVEKHLNLSIQLKSKQTYLIFDEYRTTNLVSLKGLYSHVQYTFPHLINLNHGEICCLGSCNGLLCLWYERCDFIVIWNPATRKHVKLLTERVNDILAYGFGYDSISDDYKVVVMRGPLFHSPDVVRTRLSTNVCTLSCVWRKFEEARKDIDILFCSLQRFSGVLACGSLHWVAVKSESDSESTYFFLSFNLATEKEVILTGPEFSQDDDGDDAKVCSLSVSELGGCLSIACTKKVGIFDVWVMKEYGLRESWIKQFTLSSLEIGRPIRCGVPLAYSKSGDEVLLIINSVRVTWFHLEKRTVDFVYIIDKTRHINPTICFESLVSLGYRAEND